jgi:hypothetical protein
MHTLVKESYLKFYLSIIIIALSLHGFYVSDSALGLFKPLRYFTFAIIIFVTTLFFLLIIAKQKINRIELIAISINIFMLIYGLFFAGINGGINQILQLDRVLFLLFTLPMTVGLAKIVSTIKVDNENNSGINSSLISIYFIVGTLSIILIGGLEFTPIPRFQFVINGELSYYSQGTTYLFGIGSVFFLYSASKNYNYKRALCIGLSTFFLVLSLSGGARGDFLISAIVFLAILIRLFPRYFTLSFVCVGITLVFWLLSKIDLSELLIFERLGRVFAGDTLGERDLFLLDTYELLSKKYDCLLFGCGINFFQVFHGYEFGGYPHNVVAELLVTYGILLTTPFLFMVFRGAVKGYFSPAGKTFIYYFALLTFGLSFKSGSLIGLGLIPCMIFFLLLNFCKIENSERLKNCKTHSSLVAS